MTGMCGHAKHRRPLAPEGTMTDLRVADRDREGAVEALRAHAAAGRLDLDELGERTEAALTARTGRDLGAVTDDLPSLRPQRRARTRDRAAEVRTYALVIAALVVIWLATGAGHPWPLYPALGWGLPLLAGRPDRRLATRYVPAHTTPATSRS